MSFFARGCSVAQQDEASLWDEESDAKVSALLPDYEQIKRVENMKTIS